MERTLFDADHQTFRQSFRQFVEREIKPHQQRWREQGQVDRELWRKAGAQGFLCTWLDEKWGGPGADFLCSVVIAEELARVYDVNVFAPLALVQEALPRLMPGAAIVAISSDAAVEPYAGWGGYGSSKAALEQLTAILAVEQPHLRVYRVDPGDMRTQTYQEAFPGEDISHLPPPEESVPGLLALIEGSLPSGRYRARELAGVAA